MKKYVKIKIYNNIKKNNNILEFNQYMKSDKMPFIMLNLYLKKQVDVPIIQKILQQQKQMSIFLVDIQCQQFGHWIIQKTNILYIAKKTV